MEEQSGLPERTRDVLNLTYVGAMIGLVFPLVLIGFVIYLYIQQDDIKDAVGQAHVDRILKGFWIWLALIFVGVILSVVIIGYLVILGANIWFLVRMVKGYKAFRRGEAPNSKPRPAVADSKGETG